VTTIHPRLGHTWPFDCPAGWVTIWFSFGNMRRFLDGQLPGSWIRCGGPTVWPRRSSDLSPLGHHQYHGPWHSHETDSPMQMFSSIQQFYSAATAVERIYYYTNS